MSESEGTAAKRAWGGVLRSVQARIRLMRSFDERSHSYLGYVLRVDGTLDGDSQTFRVALGKAAQTKHAFRVGDRVEGKAVAVADPRLETAELYKASGLVLCARAPASASEPPPWLDPPPTLTVYRERGHRRLAARTYETKCSACMWGTEMAVEIVVDHWNPSQLRYRRETFCYGPKSCPLHAAGPTRKVPGRKSMRYEESDEVDEDRTAHRGPDD